MRAVPRPPLDPGLQGERTSLAWTRTSLAALVNGLLVVRAGVVSDVAVVTGVGLALSLAAAVVGIFGHARSRELIGRRSPRAAYARVATTFAVALGAAVFGIVVIAVT